MKNLYVLVLLLAFSMSVNAGVDCNQAVPSGYGCIHGHAFGPANAGGAVDLCYDWDTSCSSPAVTIYNFHDTGENYRDWEFWAPATNSFIVLMHGSYYFYWDPDGPVTTPLIYNQQTYFMYHVSYCTDAGYYDLGYDTCAG